MSLARIGHLGSDVYVYASVLGGYVCAGSGHRFSGDADAMIRHLHMHQREGGDHVPPEVFDALSREDDG